MKSVFAFAAIGVMVAALTGCAVPGGIKDPVNDVAAQGREAFKQPWICAVGGALVAGGLASTESKNAGLIGAVVGGAIGYFACNFESRPEADGDKDGVPDNIDMCPATVKGAKVQANGCGPDADTDMDGVPDVLDKCAATVRGAKVDAKGCVPTSDADGDGIPDSADLCPNTVAGATVLPNGCEEDTDYDGIPDSRDRCAGTPKGVTVGTDGCALDEDGDGVSDLLDRCPGTRNGTKVDPAGCEAATTKASPTPASPKASAIPDTMAPVAGAAAGTVLSGINFESGSARIKAGSFPVLDDVVVQLKSNPGMKSEIAGFTDDSGSPALNRALSQRRAEAVMNYLISKGIPADGLTAKGYGPDQPVAANDTPEGKARNRRVELRPVLGN